MKLSALVIDLTDGQYEYMLFFHGFLVGLPLNFQFRQITSLFLSLEQKAVSYYWSGGFLQVHSEGQGRLVH